MAAKTYRARVVVLRKTKLREKDLIVTLLDEQGMLRQAVAKGARKPGGSFAARLELFSVVDAWFAQGRTLDVVTDAKFSPEYEVRQYGLEQAACASAIAEIIVTVAQEGLASDRLFEMTTLAFEMIADAQPETAAAICAADMLKTLAMAGFRPSFDVCVSCGRAVDWSDPKPSVLVSIPEGGIVCGECTGLSDAMRYDADVIGWARAFLSLRFSEIIQTHPDFATTLEILQIAGLWAQVHAGRKVKSIDYLMTVLRV